MNPSPPIQNFVATPFSLSPPPPPPSRWFASSGALGIVYCRWRYMLGGARDSSGDTSGADQLVGIGDATFHTQYR